MFYDIIKEIGSFFIKIAPFLVIGLFFVGLLHIFFSKKFVSRHIGKDNISSIVKASVFGVPLPLCSCGVIPTAVFMAKNGASKSAVISFLISTPQTGIDSILATYGMLGWVFAIYRPIVAFTNGIIGGIIVKIFSKKENLNIQVENQEKESDCNDGSCQIELPAQKVNKIKKMYKYAFVEFLDDIGIHFIAGIIIAGLISYFIPNDFFIKYNINSGLLSMLIMAVIGIPMYVCATASIPIALALMSKGVSPGAAFVFLVLGPLTNAASITILLKILKKKILFLYLGTSAVLAVLFGLFLDFVFNFYQFKLPLASHSHHHISGFKKVLYYGLAILLALALLGTIYRKYLRRFFMKKNKNTNDDVLLLNIEGMSCNHCANNVKTSLSKLKNIKEVDIDLAGKKGLITGTKLKADKIIKTIENIGYQASVREE